MKLIVGLGNPGEKYQNTRHNLGFMVLDEYAKKHLGPKIEWQLDKKFDSEVLQINNLYFLKPQTHMNASGLAVFKFSDYFKISPSEIAVCYDELDLPMGKIKVKKGGSSAGHKGVESIIKSLDTDQFIRIRLGIGNLKSKSGERKEINFKAQKYVVEPFLSNEKTVVKKMIKASGLAIDLLKDQGLGIAQNQYN